MNKKHINILFLSLLIILVSITSVNATEDNATNEIISSSQDLNIEENQVYSDDTDNVIQDNNIILSNKSDKSIKKENFKENKKVANNKINTKMIIYGYGFEIDENTYLINYEDLMEYKILLKAEGEEYPNDLNKNISLKFNNNSFSVTLDEDGSYFGYFYSKKYSVEPNKQYEVGPNYISVIFEGDEKYNPSSASIIIEVYPYRRIDTDFDFDPTTTDFETVNETFDIVGQLRAIGEENEITDAEVVLEIQNKTYTTIINEDGTFSFPIVLEEEGEYEYSFTYYGNDEFFPICEYYNCIIYAINEKVVNLSVNGSGYYNYDEDVIISGKLTDRLGNPLKYQKIIAFYDDSEYYLTTKSDGSYSIKLHPLEVGEYCIDITYEGNEKYQYKNKYILFTIVNKTKAILNINPEHETYFYEYIEIYGNVTDINGKPTEGIINIYENNIFIGSTDVVDGYFGVMFIGEIGINNYTFEFKGNYNFDDSKTITLEILPEKEVTQVDFYMENEYIFGDDIIINITLNGVKNRPVMVYVNGKEFDYTTDDYGNISVNVENQVICENNITVVYVSGKYDPTTSCNVTKFFYLLQERHIVLDIPSKANFGDTISISGKIFSKDTPLEKNIVVIDVGDKTYYVTTDKHGYFSVNHTLSRVNGEEGPFYTLDKVYVFVLDDGEYQYAEEVATIEIKHPAELYMYKIYNTNKDKTIKVSGKLLRKMDKLPITGKIINITVNDKQYTAISDKNGYFTVNHTVDSYDIGNVTFSYAGNDYIPSCTNSTNFVVKKPVELYMYKIYNTNKDKTIKVSGKTLSQGNPVKGLTVNITINNKKYTTTSDKNGYFTINHTVDTYNNTTVKFRFPGNSLYESCTNTTTFIVKQPVELYIYKIYNTNKGKSIKISGKLLSNTKPVKGLTVNITVNNKKYAPISDKNGYFTVNYTVYSYNNGSVKFRFPGNSLYESCTNTTTFVVKQPVSIYMYPRTSETYGKSIKVSGKLLCNVNGVKGQIVKITINGKEYNATTVGYGYFTINYTINGYDTHKVVYKYAGSSLYESCTNTTTFTIKPLNPISTKITLDKISNTQYTDSILIKGKLTDKDSKTLPNTNIKLTINSKEYTIKTDAKGTFNYNYKTNSVGSNNITVTFTGNSTYLGTNTKITFNVVSKQTKIIINSITKSDDEYITVKGKYNDLSGTNLTYTPLTVIVDSKTGSTKTDANGNFEYKFKTTSNNKIEISYQGNQRYAGTNQSTAFYQNNTQITYSKSTIMSIDNIDDTTKSNTVKITGKYTDKDGTKLTYTPIKININGKEYETKTDGNGLFTYYYKTETTGIHNVSASYHGNSRYSGTTAKTTFNVA